MAPNPPPRSPDASSVRGRLEAARPILLVSPPRANSSVFATAVSRSPDLDTYLHEPCGPFAYQSGGIPSILRELEPLTPRTVIKEMTFQMADLAVAEAFFRGCRSPVVFLIRSPLLTIESRVRMVLKELAAEAATDDRTRASIAAAVDARSYGPVAHLVTEARFPLQRTGWADLGDQLALCRSEGIEHLIVETSAFRRDPVALLEAFAARVGIGVDPAMIRWERGEAQLAGALAEQAIWYERVTGSAGIEPPDPHSPSPEDLPPRFRDHLATAMGIYEAALADKTRLLTA